MYKICSECKRSLPRDFHSCQGKGNNTIQQYDEWMKRGEDIDEQIQ